ncbi:hypothetical protein PR048_013600 [Dryococelus australis]|uniref:Uncharacterized protein n=1 Tax=Dryococelus australis TaxID=614101 RepID=A0ABQ9HSM3_9NEOP|nr:hypothetical protein PR048_013600 [Dryococelus australis]
MWNRSIYSSVGAKQEVTAIYVTNESVTLNTDGANEFRARLNGHTNGTDGCTNGTDGRASRQTFLDLSKLYATRADKVNTVEGIWSCEEQVKTVKGEADHFRLHTCSPDSGGGSCPYIPPLLPAICHGEGILAYNTSAYVNPVGGHDSSVQRLYLDTLSRRAGEERLDGTAPMFDVQFTLPHQRLSDTFKNTLVVPNNPGNCNNVDDEVLVNKPGCACNTRRNSPMGPYQAIIEAREQGHHGLFIVQGIQNSGDRMHVANCGLGWCHAGTTWLLVMTVQLSKGTASEARSRRFAPPEATSILGSQLADMTASTHELRKDSVMAFIKEPSQRLPGVTSGNHGIPNLGGPDKDSNPHLHECESSMGDKKARTMVGDEMRWGNDRVKGKKYYEWTHEISGMKGGNRKVHKSFDSWWGHSEIFPHGNHAGRCRWSAGILGNLLFLLPLQSGAAPYSPQSPSMFLKTSLLRAAQISSLAHFVNHYIQENYMLYVCLHHYRSARVRQSQAPSSGFGDPCIISLNNREKCSNPAKQTKLEIYLSYSVEPLEICSGPDSKTRPLAPAAKIL